MEQWVLSANPKYFDHVKAFNDLGYIDWKQTRKFSVGDIVFVYVTKPVSRIQFKTKVVAVDMKMDEISDLSMYWLNKKPMSTEKTRFARLLLVKEYKDDRFAYSILRNNGMVYPPQSPYRVKNELRAYITEREDNLDG